MTRLRHHWPEYAIEALCLALFMLSAAAFATLFQHPRSPLAGWDAAPIVRRVPLGLAMGLTAVALIHSPLGRRSGAHLNPAVTLTYCRLGKVSRWDAAAYIAAQFAGAGAGIAIAAALVPGWVSAPAVNYVATVPGAAGAAAAFAAEAAISFLMMAVVLFTSNARTFARYTGMAAGALVATFIVIEAPLSGMSMNPARTLGSNLFAGLGSSLWIYFLAPPLGMLAAAELFVRARTAHAVRCAKLLHDQSTRCIFRCGYAERDACSPTAATT
jgi:aquaporin Z